MTTGSTGQLGPCVIDTETEEPTRTGAGMAELADGDLRGKTNDTTSITMTLRT